MKSISSEKVLHYLCLYIFYISLIVVPLYMRNAYFSLIEAKASMYRRLVIPALAACFLILVFCFIKDRIKNANAKPVEIRLSVFFLTAIPGWALFSSYCSADKRASFYGIIGWAMGSLMTLVLTMSTYMISRHLRFHINIMLPVILVNIPIFLLGMAQSAGYDLFDLLKYIDQKYYYSYISTIGQKNSYAGYLCLLLPLFWGFFAASTEKFSEIVYGIISFLGFLSIIISESDSVYAGLGICTVFMLPFFLSSAQKTKKAALLLLMFGVSQLIVGYHPIFAGKAAIMEDISAIMISGPCAAGVLSLGAVLFVFAHWVQQSGHQKALKILLILAEVILIAGICAAVVYTVRHFNDDWGTRRGIIWRISWEQFLAFPTKRKWIGIGPELLAIVYAEIRVAMNANIVAAHCEALHVLLAQGIVGLCLYLAFWIYLFVLFFRRKLWRENGAVFFFPLAAYLGQSLFCSVYPITGIVFSVMAGLYLQLTEKIFTVKSLKQQRQGNKGGNYGVD